jgi:hypothetical protein
MALASDLRLPSFETAKQNFNLHSGIFWDLIARARFLYARTFFLNPNQFELRSLQVIFDSKL